MGKIWEIIWRSLLIGFIYILTTVFAGMIIGLFGFSFPEVQQDTSTLLLINYISGVLIGLTLGPIARFILPSRKRHIIIWSSIIFLNTSSVMVEGYFFAPQLLPAETIPSIVIQQFLTALVSGIAINALFTVKSTGTHSADKVRRTFFSWAWRFIASCCSYLLFYYIFGSMNYTLITKPYYDTHVGGLTVPEPKVVLIAEIVRSVMIIMSVFYLSASLPTSRKKSLSICGMVLFIIGGIIPLLMQINTLPAILLAASAVEIFFQNFSTGVVTAYLLSHLELKLDPMVIRKS